jgi:heme-degrading monooxygenase HmoA
MDQAIRIYRNDVAPAVSQRTGFLRLYFLSDRDTGRGISITFWQSEADMAAGETSGFHQQQVAKFKDVLGAPAVGQTYEVSVQA